MYWKFRSFIFISYFENSYFTSLKSFENCSSFENNNSVHLRFRIQLTSVSCIVIRHCTSYKKKQGLSSSPPLLGHPPTSTTDRFGFRFVPASASDLRLCFSCGLSSSFLLFFPPLSSSFLPLRAWLPRWGLLQNFYNILQL